MEKKCKNFKIITHSTEEEIKINCKNCTSLERNVKL